MSANVVFYPSYLIRVGVVILVIGSVCPRHEGSVARFKVLFVLILFLLLGFFSLLTRIVIGVVSDFGDSFFLSESGNLFDRASCGRNGRG